MLLLAAACSSSSDDAGATSAENAECAPGDSDGGAPSDDTPKADVLEPSRLLRRASLALRGTSPTDAELDALAAAGDADAQRRFVGTFVDQTLGMPVFYRTMFEFAREWFNTPLMAATADEPEYGAEQQRSVVPCAAGTAKAGALYYYRHHDDPCDGLNADGTPVLQLQVEAWWAPGTMTTLIGDAANTEARALASPGYNDPTMIDCAPGPEGACGCGPHAVGCHFDDKAPGMQEYVWYNPEAQRRLLADEPARLFAHIAWYDRPATDLIANTYSVAPTKLQVAYVRQGIASGALQLLDDDRWWQPAKFSSAPTDPEHAPADPAGWREFQVPDRNPYILADRDYHFDPRVEAGPMRGMPAAGMLTSLGFLDGLPRERLRAARALENLACEQLSPPEGLTFNPYQRDPYSEGPCQHCHKRIDPAAVHFKRWGRTGYASEGWGATFPMPGIGPNWHWPKSWRTSDYPYDRDPWSQWNRWYTHDTGMTPVSQAQIDANPEVVFIDFLVPEQTLLGQRGDGTVGPLGFAKIIIAAGAFDRCVVRKIHGQIMGRDIDPTTEAGYLDVLTEQFVASGRRVRPLVKALTQSDLFQRGL